MKTEISNLVYTTRFWIAFIMHDFTLIIKRWKSQIIEQSCGEGGGGKKTKRIICHHTTLNPLLGSLPLGKCIPVKGYHRYRYVGFMP